MITTLHIKNIGIIDDIVIDLNKGLNVLTGETGAGKTLIVDSLGIIAGGRFSKDMIRRGQNMSFVELALYLPDNPNSIDGNIVVSREINTSGKNLCKINGRLVTVNELKNFMKNIIDIHGQYDNQTLMDTEFHTKYLDKFIGTRIAEIHKKYVELYTEYIELNKMLKNNYGDEIEKQRKLDLLQYQYKEIKAANLKNGEDEQLEEKRKIIMSSEKVAEALNIVSNNLEGNIIDVINDSIRALEKIEDVNSKYSEKLVEMKNIYYEVEDNKEIIRDISLQIEDHFVAITGPNGGGKSTLAKIIAGIVKPTNGQILLDGEDITGLNITERANKGISFAFQQPVHFKGLTVRDLITIAAGKKLSVNEICDILSEVGLCAREYIDREINNSLSGGELKRIEIAMITARGTKLSIFDEPEAGIDLWSFNSLIRVFEKMRDEIQGTILIISHQERILDIAEKIIVIADGQLKKIGTKQEVLPELLGTAKACQTLTEKL